MSCCGPQRARDFDEDREGVSDEDLSRFGGDDVECPECGASVYFDVPLCPSCGFALSGERPGPLGARKVASAWGPTLAGLAAAGVLVWFLVQVV